VVEHVLAGAVLLAWHATKDALKKGQAGGSGKDGNSSGIGRSKSSGGGRRNRGKKESSDPSAQPRDDAQRLRLVRVLETNSDATTVENDDAASEGAVTDAGITAAAATPAMVEPTGSVACGGGGFIGLCLPPGADAEAVVASLQATFAAAAANGVDGAEGSAGVEAVEVSIASANANEEATKETAMDDA